MMVCMVSPKPSNYEGPSPWSGSRGRESLHGMASPFPPSDVVLPGWSQWAPSGQWEGDVAVSPILLGPHHPAPTCSVYAIMACYLYGTSYSNTVHVHMYNSKKKCVEKCKGCISACAQIFTDLSPAPLRSHMAFRGHMSVSENHTKTLRG